MDFDLILHGNKEFYPGLNNKTYYVLKVDTEKKIKWMSNFFTDFINKAKTNNKKHYLGIDFEFNRVRKTHRNVALMQINLEVDDDINGYIMVLYPPELPKNDLNLLIKLVSEPLIIKILHGAESLDIPYMFDQLLNSNQKLINGLCTNFYDTKYLCDYMHISEKIKKSCSIYYLLTENKIITEKKIIELESIEERTGPLYLINIDIHNLSTDIFNYSLYDVLFLPELIKKYIKKGIIYEKIIPQITCASYKFKRDIETEFYELEKIVSTFNNYFILESTNKINLNLIWEFYYYSIGNNYIFHIKEISNLKKFIEIITKMIIYDHVIQIFTVYKNNKKKLNKPDLSIFNKFYFWIEKYPDLFNLINDYSDIIIYNLIYYVL